ncbi:MULTISPECIES: GrpB family protein [unclassified Halobacteriovorax]|uniref:GrpB family protein n=1 Tax=unclassified Halobacteriovorax TaxID=2639665 RepID=UPI003999621C
MQKVFTVFEEHGLGLERDNKVRFVDHNNKWRDVFKFESKRIADSLNINSLKLHHCGSTAIPNIVAKPIIDIVGETSCLEELDKKKELLEKLGYEYKGEYGIEGRRYSVLYNFEKTKGFCHLHIFESGSKELKDHIIFKDYLISNPSAALRYEELKKSLDIPRSEYSNAKTEIISELLEEAYKERSSLYEDKRII